MYGPVAGWWCLLPRPPLLHGLEHGALGFRHGAIDFVGKQDVVENRALDKAELTAVAIVNGQTGNIRRQQRRWYTERGRTTSPEPRQAPKPQWFCPVRVNALSAQARRPACR